MGLLKHLLFWPVTGPSYLTRFSLEKVEGAVRSEVTDDAGVKRDLMELQMQLELGDIDEDEYVEREAELMRQLREVRRWREQFGMPVSGGLVRVADDADDEPPPPREAPREAPRQDQDPGRAPTPQEADRVQDAGAAEEGPSVGRPDAAEVDIVLDFDED